jgi:NitT/TauT family transport system permease protein
MRSEAPRASLLVVNGVDLWLAKFAGPAPRLRDEEWIHLEILPGIHQTPIFRAELQVRSPALVPGEPEPDTLSVRLGASKWRAYPSATLPIGILVLIACWQLLAVRVDARYLLPEPMEVVDSARKNAGLIAYHGQMTLLEVLLGFGLGFGLALVLGYAISRSLTIERIVTPYIVASQAIPIVAIAPLLFIWLKDGFKVKVLAAALIVFFPMLVNTVVGLRNIPEQERDLMRIMSASRWQTLRRLEVPAALPVLLAGVRVGLTLSVIGAVVGEFVVPDRGIGVLLVTAKNMYNGPLMFAALAALITLAFALYGTAALLERLLLQSRR